MEEEEDEEEEEEEGFLSENMKAISAQIVSLAGMPLRTGIFFCFVGGLMGFW